MNIPPGAEVITTFAEYGKLVKGFFEGHYKLLILIGRPGLSKTYEFERQMASRDDTYLLRGISTPYKLYINLYDHADFLVVLDDAEVVWADKQGRVLLRALCEMKKPTTVSWEKHNTWMVANGYDNSFRTSSPVCLICNAFHFGGSSEFAAISDRGHTAVFDPPASEVHAYANSWFPGQSKNAAKVYEFVGERLQYLPDLSFRVYERVLQSLNAGRDWKGIFENSYMGHADLQLVISLELDKTLTPAERLKAYQAKAHNSSRSAYYKYRAMALRHS